MVRLIILALLLYLLYRVVKGVLGAGRKGRTRRPDGVIDEMVQDPFCKTYVPLRDAYRRVINGEEHFFCGKACADRFLEESRDQE